MRRYSRGIGVRVAVLTVAVMMIAAYPAHTEEVESTDASKPAPNLLTPLTDELDAMGMRLRRGASNTGLGWLEIPNGIQEIGSKHGVGAAATWGLVHGTGRAVQRTAVGLFELVTFPFKLTESNKPMIEPESVLDRPKEEEPAAQ
jgi:putative exosortase-associated protein (TIGR04073 family)